MGTGPTLLRRVTESVNPGPSLRVLGCQTADRGGGREMAERVPRPYRLRTARSHRLDSSLRAVAQHRLFTVVRSKLTELR